MFKPYLIYNGERYLALCTEHDFSGHPMNHHDIVFIDSISDDIILDITCSISASIFNRSLEDRYSIASDIRLSNSEYYGVKDVFSIITQRTTDMFDIDEHEYLFLQLNDFVTDHGDCFVFDMVSFMDSIDMKGIFRVYLVLNLPSIIMNKDDIIYDSLSTFFGVEWMYDFNYELSENDYMIEFKSYYMHPQREMIDRLIGEVESYNASSKHPIKLATNNTNHPMIRSIGEIQVKLTFEKNMFKKQLFFIFRSIKNLLEEDVAIKIIA